MKSLLTLLALSLATQASAQGTFKLDINIKNAEGQKVLLQYGSNTDMHADSTVVKNGRASFAGTLKGNYASGFVVFGEYNPMSPDTKYLRPYLDANATTTINADLNDLNGAAYTGGRVQSQSNELEAYLAPIKRQQLALSKAYESAQDAGERDAIRAKMAPYSEFYKAAATCFVKTHPDSPISAEQMLFLQGDMSYSEIKAIYDSWTPEVKATDEGKEVEKELNTLARVQPGSPAPDFTANDINGKSFSLSSLKGKVVILDFWASWCVPCRKSNPHMLELYKKYHDQGLEMVYVSDDDRNEGAWRKAVEKDQLTADGIHHVLRGLKWDQSMGVNGADHTNDISDKYAVHYLPTKYLVDRQGNIVCKIGEQEEKMLDIYLAAELAK